MTDQQPKQPEKKRQQRSKGRANGEGSVFKRKTGARNKPWVAQITLSSGQKRIIGYYETEKEAIIAKQEALALQKRGRLNTGPRQTFREYLEYWLENIYKPSVKVTTYIQCRSILNARILPALGHIQLAKLTLLDVQAFYGA